MNNTAKCKVLLSLSAILSSVFKNFDKQLGLFLLAIVTTCWFAPVSRAQSVPNATQFQNWGDANPLVSPSARNGHGMVYDPVRSKTILVGGQDAFGNYMDDVWEWDTATKTWTDVTPGTGSRPAPRALFGIAYDPIRDRVLIYGGSTNTGFIGDTWEWDPMNRAWTIKSPDALGRLSASKLSYDPIRQQVILFGGRTVSNFGVSITCAWDGTNWINLAPSPAPTARSFHSMATDTTRSRIVMYGGYNGNLLEDTWEWNGSTWTQMTVPTGDGPGRLNTTSLAYDTTRQIMVLFGGVGTVSTGFTWEWDGQSWSQKQPCDDIPYFDRSAMVYDIAQRKQVLFGSTGLTAISYFASTYLYGSGAGISPCGDASPPTTSSTFSSPPNSNGWHNDDVTITFTSTDNEDGSGIAVINYSASGAQSVPLTVIEGPTVSLIVSAEGETSLTYWATDVNGNSEPSQSLVIRLDKTPPTLACGSTDGAWHEDDVLINCSAGDNISQLANASDASFSLVTSVASGTEITHASTNQRSVCDNAGNCATAGPISGNKIDKKGPVITITSPIGGTYLLNQSVTVNFNCTDGGSGVASCIGTSANGSALNTASVGSKTFTVSATDSVGNSGSPSVVNYTVGFGLQVLFDQTKAHKSGSNVPIKIRLVDANGANVSSEARVVHAVSVVQTGNQASPILEDAGNANPDFDFRYDASLGGYIFNLKTSGYGTGSYVLNFIAGNGSIIYCVDFQVRQ